MLKRIQINRNSPENKALKEIYDNAFPYDERVPYYDYSIYLIQWVVNLLPIMMERICWECL